MAVWQPCQYHRHSEQYRLAVDLCYCLDIDVEQPIAFALRQPFDISFREPRHKAYYYQLKFHSVELGHSVIDIVFLNFVSGRV